MVQQFDRFVATYIAVFGNPSQGQIDYEKETVILTIGVAAVMDENPNFKDFKLEAIGEPFKHEALSPFPVERYRLVRS
jgi:hypothetical protein